MIIPRKTEVFFLIPFNETANKKCSQVYFVVFNVKFNNSKWKNDFFFFLLYMVWSSMRGCVYLSLKWASLALPSIFFKWLLTVHVFGTMLSSRFREMFPVASRVPTIIQTVEAFLYLFFVFFFFNRPAPRRLLRDWRISFLVLDDPWSFLRVPVSRWQRTTLKRKKYIL